MSKSFDSLSFAAALAEGGFSEQQAKALAKAIWELIDSQLVTKADLAAMEERLTLIFDHKLYGLRCEFKADMAALKEELTMRMLGILVLQTGITAVLFKVLH
jgi:hypothetical protein